LYHCNCWFTIFEINACDIIFLWNACQRCNIHYWYDIYIIISECSFLSIVFSIYRLMMEIANDVSNVILLFCEWWPSFLRTPSEFRLWEVTKLSLSDTIYSTFVIILYIVIIKMYKSRGNNCCFLFVASVNRVKIYFECVSHCISRKVVQTPR
jgi:hypothetical protein